MRREGIFYYRCYSYRTGPREIALRVAKNYARYTESVTRPMGARSLWGKRMGVPSWIYLHFNGKLLDMLCGCADESARRLLVFGFRQ